MRKGEFAMRAQNLTLLTDLYELTMMQGYYENPSDQIVVFDAFYRKNPCGGAYAVCAGLEQVIEYVRDLHFSPDDIDYLRSGTLCGAMTQDIDERAKINTSRSVAAMIAIGVNRKCQNK